RRRPKGRNNRAASLAPERRRLSGKQLTPPNPTISIVATPRTWTSPWLKIQGSTARPRAHDVRLSAGGMGSPRSHPANRNAWRPRTRIWASKQPNAPRSRSALQISCPFCRQPTMWGVGDNLQAFCFRETTMRRFFSPRVLLTLVVIAGSLAHAQAVRADGDGHQKVLPATAWVMAADGKKFSCGTRCLGDRERQLLVTGLHQV